MLEVAVDLDLTAKLENDVTIYDLLLCDYLDGNDLLVLSFTCEVDVTVPKNIR